MSAPVSESDDGAVEAYRTALRRPQGARLPHRQIGFDELVGAEGVHAEDEQLAGTVDDLGLPGLRTKTAEAARYVRSDGITYGSQDGAQARRWQIDPLPVILTRPEWAALEQGLEQRTRLLDLVLRDIYGSRTLLRRGVLPPEIVLGHSGFIRQADGVRLPTAQQLIFSATDVARAADGSWVAFGDRAQAPSGAGYAMATRRIVTRTLPRLHRRTSTARLRGFFHTVRSTLQDLAQSPTETPRVVVLSPGAGSETAFDQAFLATLLGFPLVEGDDLTMRDGRVWMRTPGAVQPIDVVLRRVDAEWADPLEMRTGSQLGVPGLIDAARRGQVSIVNPMGSGVLENPALGHFLGRASTALLGEDLVLPGPQSWWCGDATDRQHVLSELPRLVIKPLRSDEESRTRFGWLLSADDQAQLRARIETEPWAWTAQEPLPESTAPVVTRAGLEPRRLVLRTFGVAHGDGFVFLPGALGRAASETEEDVVSNARGALAKDTWVLTGRESAGEPWTGRSGLAGAGSPTDVLAPRMADDLFWFGRYAERVEQTARLLQVADDLTEDYTGRPGALGAIAMSSIQHAVTMATGVSARPGAADGPDLWSTEPGAHLQRLVLDGELPGSLAHAAGQLVGCAQRVRDHLSLTTWPVLSRLEQTLQPDAESGLQQQLGAVLESALALSGVCDQGMIRDRTWAYVDVGLRLERSIAIVELLHSTLAIERSPVIEGQVVEAVLHVGESVITYRRRTAAGEGPAAPAQAALQLLLVDVANPRSLGYQLQRLPEDLRLVGDDEQATAAAALALELPELDLEQLGGQQRDDLDALLLRYRAGLRELTDALTERHFRRKGPVGSQPVEWTFTGAELTSTARESDG